MGNLKYNKRYLKIHFSGMLEVIGRKRVIAYRYFHEYNGGLLVGSIAITRLTSGIFAV